MAEKSLIAAYLLDGQGGGKKMSWDNIKQWTPSDGIVWIHLNLNAHHTAKWLMKESGLEKITAKSMLMDETRPRSIIYPEGLCVFLRGVNLNPGENVEDMVSIRVWIDLNCVITVRRRHLLSVDDIRNALDRGQGPKDGIDFLKVLNDRLVNRMSDAIEAVDEQVDTLESEVLTEESRLLRPKIADIRRQATMIRRYLAPQREALTSLFLEKTALITHEDAIHFRECADRILRYVEVLDAARERASITQEELSSRLSEQLDRRMYVLSLVAVIFLPLSFITGLLGINVGGIPGANYKWAFLIVCGMTLGIAGILIWLFYRKKWI